RKDALDALAERDLPHRERRPRTAAVHPDHNPFEYLNPFLVAFPYFHMDADGIARLHLRPFGHLCVICDVNRAHGRLPSSLPSTQGGFPAPPHPVPRQPAGQAAVSASAPPRAACAIPESLHDAPTPARRALSCPETRSAA